VPSDREIWTTHSRAAAKRRIEGQDLPLPPIEDLSMCMDKLDHPIMFEQRYVGKPQQDKTDDGFAEGKIPANDDSEADDSGVHLFVLVHGLQGSSFDMRLLKNNIALLYPKAQFLCSNANEMDTEVDIAQMGENLAFEVRSFVGDWCPGRPDPYLRRLSFVAYSIGGLIVRSAVPLLEEFQDRMYTFISFSSQHLGFKFASNSLVKTGVWLFKKVRNGKVYDELLMNDTPDPKDSFLSRMAKTPGLEHFQHVVLFSSYQDQYAPFESARIEVSGVVENDAQHGQLCSRLAQEILEPIQANRLMRLDVNFHIPETNFDSMIGRAAHIQFIECQPLMKMFVHSYGYLFE
jgi:hypothetical protein